MDDKTPEHRRALVALLAQVGQTPKDVEFTVTGGTIEQQAAAQAVLDGALALVRQAGTGLLASFDDHVRVEALGDADLPMDVLLPQEVVQACNAENPNMPLRSKIDRALVFISQQGGSDVAAAASGGDVAGKEAAQAAS